MIPLWLLKRTNDKGEIWDYEASDSQTAVYWVVMMRMKQEITMCMWLIKRLENWDHWKRKLQVQSRLVLLAVLFAWMSTQRLCKVDDWLCQQNVAMSSAVSASVIPLGMPTLAQPAGRNSLTDNIIPFIYEYFCFSGQTQLDFGGNVMLSVLWRFKEQQVVHKSK